ncbi:serine/threonine-protein kinase [Pseudomonas sp. Q1-7]|uniref:serine/threonine-protein kinase n=1 Tax=Pseudomonas sp. Q1-7 TaxID=3020843 RepID=UPI00230131D8|nr:serine/threonine-protein kinase [Pseudomonas sp. Q1-7]
MKLSYQTANVTFKKIKDIGQNGRNSNVFLVHDKHLNSHLAIKEIKTDGFNEEAFLEEAQMLYSSSHPNVVQVQYACNDGENIYIAMPYYANGSLKDLAEKGNLTAREIIRYAIQFLSGLNNVHSKGLLHFDIKPDNILISDRNEALISDFGLSKNMDEYGFATPDGSYADHAPPESVSTSDLDVRSDIYQVGLTLYRLCVGMDSLSEQKDGFENGAAFAAAMRKETYPDRSIYPPHIPMGLRKIVNKCIKKDPDDRYDSVIDLLNALCSVEATGLDWVYSETADRQEWTDTSCDGYKYQFFVYADGKYEGLKTKGAGAPRRVGDFCGKGIDAKQISQILSSEW